MLKYKLVKVKPVKVANNELVIEKPNFMEEVEATRGRRGVGQVASIRSIRDLLMVLSDKYDNTINPYHLQLLRYENLPYDGDKGFSDLILRVIRELNLPLIEKAIESKLITRKGSVDTILYVSDDLEGSSVFIKYGFAMDPSQRE